MPDIVIYDLDIKFPNTYTNTNLKINILDDDCLSKKTIENVFVGKERGKNLDISNKFTGDLSKVKDVHFVKGTYFDRDYFRRLYPTVNIRNNIGLAEVIIYDEKSIFENDSNPVFCYNVAGTDLYINCSNVFTRLNSVLNNIHSYDFKTLNKYFKISETNSEVISKIMKGYNTLIRSYLTKENTYFSKLITSGRPFISSEEIMTKMPSNLRQNNLSLNDCLVYLNQVTSGDESVIKAALDSMLMYSHDKYLPIQIILYLLSILKTSNTAHTYKVSMSNKVQLFKSTFITFLRNNIDTWQRADGFFHFLIDINSLCERINSSFPNIDFELVECFINSSELFSKFNMGTKYSEKLKINYVDFTLTSSILATQPKIESCAVEQKSVSEFAV